MSVCNWWWSDITTNKKMAYVHFSWLEISARPKTQEQAHYITPIIAKIAYSLSKLEF